MFNYKIRWARLFTVVLTLSAMYAVTTSSYAEEDRYVPFKRPNLVVPDMDAATP